MAEKKKADEPAAQAPSAEERIAALEKQLAEQTARTQVYEQTLKALQPKESASAQEPDAPIYYTPMMLDPAIRQRLKQTLGNWSDQDLDTHWQIIGAYLREMGQPIAQAVAHLADQTDYTRTRVTYQDYRDDLEKEVEKEFKQRMRAGRPASREELYRMVKARPEFTQKEIDAKVTERIEAEKTRAAQVASAETEGAVSGGQAKPHDTVFKSGRELSAEEFGRLSLEDKEQYLEGKTF